MASEWIEQVPEDVKQDRLQRINRLANLHAQERSDRFLHRVVTVLVENVSHKNPALVFGRTEHGRLSYFEGNLDSLKGRFVSVKISQAKHYTLYGNLIQ